MSTTLGVAAVLLGPGCHGPTLDRALMLFSIFDEKRNPKYHVFHNLRLHSAEAIRRNEREGSSLGTKLSVRDLITQSLQVFLELFRASELLDETRSFGHQGVKGERSQPAECFS